VTVKEFAIGMGPRLFSWTSKKHKTKYALRLLPIGGFVSMQNEDGIDEDIDPDDKGSFANKSVPQRMLITVAGALMNLLLGFIIMMIIVFASKSLGSTTIRTFAPNAPSSEQLMVDDEVLKVGKTRVHTWNELAYEIMNSGYEPIDITVRRNGEKIVLHDVRFATFEDSGATFGEYDFLPYVEEANLPNLMKHAFFRSVSTVKMVLDSLKGLITGRFGMDAVSGPVGVVGVVQTASKQGFLSFLYIVSVLTINLGVFNLIPFPALDGGRFLFLAIEGVRGKPINKNVEYYINFIGLMILFAFMIFVSVKDILKLII
jgi:regulator of sigma E protease